MGSFEHPSYGQLDLRLEYTKKYDKVGVEVFVDFFNVFNNQDGIQVQDLVAGAGGTAFGEPVAFLDPGRFFLGARLSF